MNIPTAKQARQMIGNNIDNERQRIEFLINKEIQEKNNYIYLGRYIYKEIRDELEKLGYEIIDRVRNDETGKDTEGRWLVIPDQLLEIQ